MASGTVATRGVPGGVGPRTTRAPGDAAVRPLPSLKDNVKRGMYYCWEEQVQKNIMSFIVLT